MVQDVPGSVKQRRKGHARFARCPRFRAEKGIAFRHARAGFGARRHDLAFALGKGWITEERHRSGARRGSLYTLTVANRRIGFFLATPMRQHGRELRMQLGSVRGVSWLGTEAASRLCSCRPTTPAGPADPD
jgi:hypothetical protein